MGGGASKNDWRTFEDQINDASKLKLEGKIGESKMKQMRKKAIENLETALDRRTFQTQKDGLREKELDNISKRVQYKFIEKECGKVAEAECMKKFGPTFEAGVDFHQRQIYESDLASAEENLVKAKALFEQGRISEAEFSKCRQDFVTLFARGPPKPTPIEASPAPASEEAPEPSSSSTAETTTPPTLSPDDTLAHPTPSTEPTTTPTSPSATTTPTSPSTTTPTSPSTTTPTSPSSSTTPTSPSATTTPTKPITIPPLSPGPPTRAKTFNLDIPTPSAEASKENKSKKSTSDMRAFLEAQTENLDTSIRGDVLGATPELTREESLVRRVRRKSVSPENRPGDASQTE